MDKRIAVLEELLKDFDGALAHDEIDAVNAAIALMRGQSEGRIAAGWFVCVNGVAVSEAFDTRQKAEDELASGARFYNDLYAEPCYVSGAYVSLPKDTADEQ